MYLQNRQFSNKHSEPTTICSCKTENKCTAQAHGKNEYSWEEEEEEEEEEEGNWWYCDVK
jgi:hypothetical protein